MFHRRNNQPNHHAGFAMLTLISAAMTVPFICVSRNIARSLREIADKMGNDGK